MKVINPKTLVLALVAAPSLLLAQGPLQPPTSATDEVGANPPLVGGNPAPTMKTLHQVEPRTPVSAATTPGDANNEFLITASGSYYLTQNLVVAGKNAIGINAADVTLDLNGFTISGFGSTSGILIGEDADRPTIRNGHLLNFSFGVNRVLSGSEEAGGGSFADLTVTGHGSIGLLGGTGWTVRNCRVQGGANSGIVVGKGSVVSHCSVRDMNLAGGTNGIQAGDGSVISDCAVSNCDVVYGVRAGDGSVVENSSVRDNTSSLSTVATFGILSDDGSVIRSCSVTNCVTVYGIFGGIGSVIEQCSSRMNTSTFTGDDVSAGIFAGSRSVIRGCVASGTLHSDTSQLFGAGISAEFSCLVIDCQANENGGAGIIVAQASEVRNCKSHFNGQQGAGPGILCNDFDTGAPTFGWNKIIGNDCTFNPVGITISTEDNLVIRNSSRGNTSNFAIIAGNQVGTITVPVNSGAIFGFGLGAGGSATTNEWANTTW